MHWNIRISGKLFVTLVFTVVALFLSMFLIGDSNRGANGIHAKDGLFMVPSASQACSLALDGEWRFYEGRLIANASEANENYERVMVPHSWNHRGYGTYNITLEGLTPGDGYCLYLYDLPSAYALYVDGQLTAKNGTVGTDPKGESVEWRPQVVYFTAKDSRADVMIQLSSFFLNPGGLIRTITFGTPETILRDQTRNIGSQMILFGGILMIGLYNLSLYLLNTHERSGGYFALFSLLVAIRIPLIGERIINAWWHAPDWGMLLKMQFIIGAAMLWALGLFMENLFPEESHPWVSRGLLGLVILFTVGVFTVPTYGLFHFDTLYLAVALAYFAYLLAVLVKAIRRNRQGGVFSFLGISFIVGAVLIDMVMPPGSRIISVGVFVFLVFQSLVIAEKYANIVEQNRMLHDDMIRDEMTDFYKKEYFSKTVDAIIEAEGNLQHSMMFIDIDDFKTINDTFGHDIGDEIIITVAGRILHSLRSSDIACRFGGDEFVIWLKNTRKEDAKAIAQRILEQIVAPIQAADTLTHISVSIGISFFPEDGMGQGPLMNRCDERMYRAKSRGKNQFCAGA